MRGRIYLFMNRGSYMSTLVLLNLLNELVKKYKMRGCAEHLIDFSTTSLINSIIQELSYIHFPSFPQKNGYDYPLLEFPPGNMTMQFSGSRISPRKIAYSPPPSHSRISPSWKLLSRKCHFIPGIIALWKFGHFKLVSKISCKVFQLETWSLVSW